VQIYAARRPMLYGRGKQGAGSRTYELPSPTLTQSRPVQRFEHFAKLIHRAQRVLARTNVLGREQTMLKGDQGAAATPAPNPIQGSPSSSNQFSPLAQLEGVVDQLIRLGVFLVAETGPAT
jgi:hypothetical protein